MKRWEWCKEVEVLAWRATELERLLVCQTQDLQITISLMQFSMELIILPPVSCMIQSHYIRIIFFFPLLLPFNNFKAWRLMGSFHFSYWNTYFWLRSSTLTWFIINFLYWSSNQEGSAFDFGELEQAIALQGVKIGNDEAKARMLLLLLLLLFLFLFSLFLLWRLIGITNWRKQRENRGERGLKCLEKKAQ